MLWPKRLLEKFKRREKPSLGPELFLTNPENETSTIVIPSRTSLCCPCLFRSRKPVDIKLPSDYPKKNEAPEKIVPIEAWGTPVLSMIAMDDDDDIVTKSPPSSRTDSIKLSQDSLETHQISSGGNSDFSSDGENTMSPRSQDSPKHNTRINGTHKTSHNMSHRMEDVPIQRNGMIPKIENMDTPVKKKGMGMSQVDSGKNGKNHHDNSRMNHENTRLSYENTRLSQENTRLSYENTRISYENDRNSFENERYVHENDRRSQESGKMIHDTSMNSSMINEGGKISHNNSDYMSHENGKMSHSSGMSHGSGKMSHGTGNMSHASGNMSHGSGKMSRESMNGMSHNGMNINENGRMSHGSGNLSHESGKMSHENGFVLHESTIVNGNTIMGRTNGMSHGYANENGAMTHGMESRSSENSYGQKNDMDMTHRSNPSTESPRRHAVSYGSGSPRRQSTMTNDSPRFKGVSISNVKPVTMSSPEKSNPSSSRTRSSGKRFISLESPGASDFEDAVQDNEDEIRRNQVYQKLQEDMKECGEIGNHEKISEHRLTKSQGDLSESSSQRRKPINSAPHVKHPENLDKFPMVGDTPSPMESSPKPDDSEQTTPTGMASTETNTPTGEASPMEPTEMALEPIEESSLPKNDTPPKPRPSLAKRRSEQFSRRESRESFQRHSLSQDPNGAFKKPKEGLQDTMVLLESTDWESIMKGLKGLVRLVRFHKELVEGNLHSICVLLGRHIKNLRSQVARAACLAAADMFDIHKKAMEPELEEVAGPLLQRTADTNRFLRADALKALDAMARQCSSGKVVQVLCLRGVHHHNGVVRCATARLFSGIVGRLGHEKFFALPKETRDKVIRSGAEMLTEGSLETRKHAKEMFTQLVPSGLLQRSLLEVVPPATMRHITKIIASLKIQV